MAGRTSAFRVWVSPEIVAYGSIQIAEVVGAVTDLSVSLLGPKGELKELPVFGGYRAGDSGQNVYKIPIDFSVTSPGQHHLIIRVEDFEHRHSFTAATFPELLRFYEFVTHGEPSQLRLFDLDQTRLRNLFALWEVPYDLPETGSQSKLISAFLRTGVRAFWEHVTGDSTKLVNFRCDVSSSVDFNLESFLWYLQLVAGVLTSLINLLDAYEIHFFSSNRQVFFRIAPVASTSLTPDTLADGIVPLYERLQHEAVAHPLLQVLQQQSKEHRIDADGFAILVSNGESHGRVMFAGQDDW